MLNGRRILEGKHGQVTFEKRGGINRGNAIRKIKTFVYVFRR